MENLFKHKIFFTRQREDCDCREEGKVRWSGIYKSSTIHNHREIGITDIGTLITQIKPFLYYLGSKDANREGDGYLFATDLVVGLFWKYKKGNDEYDYKYIRLGISYINNNGPNLFFNTLYSRFNVDYRELEKPFEIHIDVHQRYDLLIVVLDKSVDGSEDESEEKKPVPVRKPFKEDQCVICQTNKRVFYL